MSIKLTFRALALIFKKGFVTYLEEANISIKENCKLGEY